MIIVPSFREIIRLALPETLLNIFGLAFVFVVDIDHNIDVFVEFSNIRHI